MTTVAIIDRREIRKVFEQPCTWAYVNMDRQSRNCIVLALRSETAHLWRSAFQSSLSVSNRFVFSALIYRPSFASVFHEPVCRRAIPSTKGA